MPIHYSDDQVEITKIVVGPMVNNVFVVRCVETGEAVLVDAADEPDILVALARQLNVGDVLTTHGHGDHIQAVPAMRDAGHRVGVGPADAAMLPAHDFEIADDDVIEVGRLRLRAVHTPGHTPGSTCFVIEGSPVLLSGDTLFPGGPGNTRRNPTNFATIIRSIQQRLFVLPDETVVMPGHGDDTTIGTERPHLQEWIDRGW
ncbi:MAG TPA: MBL fold metallo-hydrolase [Acidimicrobiales bacterium]|jgi:glyoxylase-like metal-dependent hydrolase (beta-lactamase superfamily II)|nr:MBL fold metallo-hydrolase [Acidimicrobiales bacterium]